MPNRIPRGAGRVAEILIGQDRTDRRRRNTLKGGRPVTLRRLVPLHRPQRVRRFLIVLGDLRVRQRFTRCPAQRVGVEAVFDVDGLRDRRQVQDSPFPAFFEAAVTFQ